MINQIGFDVFSRYIYQLIYERFDDRNNMEEEILKLKGKAADAFLVYDRKTLSPKEKSSIKKAREYYLKHCDC